VNAYDVRQLTAMADWTGHITVRASVENTAQQVQPLPLLRVTFQDRLGNRVAVHDVQSESYSPAGARSSFLSAGQRIYAVIPLVDPGANAVAFEIDACLPAPGGGMACASDSTKRLERRGLRTCLAPVGPALDRLGREVQLALVAAAFSY
jgi:hypothetical protein